MKPNNGLIKASLLAVFCFISTLYGQTEPNEQDIQLDKEKMEQLRAGYKEFLEAAKHLHDVVEQANLEVPLLGETEKAFKDNEEFRHRGLAKEQQRYWQYLKDSKDPNEIKRIFYRLRNRFGARELAKAIEDPNQEMVLKLPMVAVFRVLMSKPDQKNDFVESLKASPLTFFDVNEPNDDVLWENYKNMHIERAGLLEAERQKIIEETGVPEWLANYAGREDFAQGAFELYESGLVLLTPEEVRQAEIFLLNTEHNLDKIYPEWFNMRHLLTDQANPQDEAIVQEAIEHLRTWPVAHNITK
jgi:hypothetical protein